MSHICIVCNKLPSSHPSCAICNDCYHPWSNATRVPKAESLNPQKSRVEELMSLQSSKKTIKESNEPVQKELHESNQPVQKELYEPKETKSNDITKEQLSIERQMQECIDKIYNRELSDVIRVKELQKLYRIDNTDWITTFQICYWVIRIDRTSIEEMRELNNPQEEKNKKKGNSPTLLEQAMSYFAKITNYDLEKFYPIITRWIEYGKQEPEADGNKLMTILLATKHHYHCKYLELTQPQNQNENQE